MNEKELAQIKNNQNPNPARWWKHRRRHSYLSLFGLFFLIWTAIAMPSDSLEAASPVFQTIAWIFGLIILSYILAATAEDIAAIKNN